MPDMHNVGPGLQLGRRACRDSAIDVAAGIVIARPAVAGLRRICKLKQKMIQNGPGLRCQTIE